MVVTVWLLFLVSCRLDDISYRFDQFQGLQEIEGFMIISTILEFFE